MDGATTHASTTTPRQTEGGYVLLYLQQPHRGLPTDVRIRRDLPLTRMQLQNTHTHIDPTHLENKK